jgi:lipoprotein-anchoring transpeptidase ErfK/SrfK
MPPPRVRSAMRAATVALVLSVAVAACQPAGGAVDGPSRGPDASGSETPASRARISIVPRSGKRQAKTGDGLSIAVRHGTLTGVTAEADGEPVEGSFADGKSSWHSDWALATDTHYVVRATAVDDAGLSVTRSSRFRTLTPESSFSTTIFEGYHKTYGVGMPIILDFSAPIENKRAVERSLQITTSRPVVGAWYWDGDRRLYFRPRTYWRPDTRVGFVGHLDGVEGSPGVYGVHTLTQSFQIGRSLIVVANTQTHHAFVYLDKKEFGDWPMSAGKPGDDTPNGTYLSMEKHNPEEMIGPGYDIEVPYSVRFTLSGDFLHDAFWSVNDQGFANVSHGCINLSPENAKTYYGMSVQGDPITVAGSPRAGTWGNGWTVWFLTWPQFVKGSALHQAVRAGPHGSRFVDPKDLPPVHAKAPLGTSKPGNSEPTS